MSFCSTSLISFLPIIIVFLLYSLGMFYYSRFFFSFLNLSYFLILYAFKAEHLFHIALAVSDKL